MGWTTKRKTKKTGCADGGIDPRIIAFIRCHHVLTLATAVEDEPWCANLFYAWLDDPGCFVFTSDEGTRHVADATRNDLVAGSVVLESRVVGRLQGLQFQGVVRRADPAPGATSDEGEVPGTVKTEGIKKIPGTKNAVETIVATDETTTGKGAGTAGIPCGCPFVSDAAARKAYLRRFPYVAAMTLNVWTIEPVLLKFTDNRLGFGKKLIWRAPPGTRR